MKLKMLLIMGIFCFGLGSCGNAQKDKGKEEFQVKAKREVITMADIKNIPMDFWKSGLIIKGCKITLPCKLSDLQKIGWELRNPEIGEDKLSPRNGNSQTTIIDKDEDTILVSFYNPYSKDIPLKDGFIFRIESNSFFTDQGIIDFVINGLKSREATQESVLERFVATLGEPDYVGKNQAAENSTVEYWFTTYKENYDLDLHIEIGISTVGKYKGKLAVFNIEKYGNLLDCSKWEEKLVPANNTISESYGDSLIGKGLVSLQTFDLYDKPNGEVIMTCEYDNGESINGKVYGYTCRGVEIQGNWIKLESVAMITIGEPLTFSGWTKWRENDTIVFETFK